MHACVKYLYHVHPVPVYTNISLSCSHRYILICYQLCIKVGTISNV